MGNDKNNRSYYAPTGGLPPQTQLLTDRAMFTEAYAVIPKGTFSDIVTSFLPFWDKTRLWVIARPSPALPRLSRNTSWKCSRAAVATVPNWMKAQKACCSWLKAKSPLPSPARRTR